MPIFNKREHVVAAIESVLKQSWGDFELNLIDDGSTDGSYEAAADIADPRVTLVRQQNAGVAAARNHGIRISRREWVAFIDADDLWFKSHLDELRQVIESLPQSGLVATDYMTGRMPAEEVRSAQASARALDYFAEAASRIGIVWTSAAAARRDALEAVGGFPAVGSGEDLVCWAALALRYPVGYSEGVTAFYRQGTGGIMDQSERREVETGLPRSIADVSPSVRYLLERTSEIEAPQRDGVDRYIASRLESAIRGEIAVGAFARAKQWAALGREYAAHFQRSTRFLLKLPDWLLRNGRVARQRLRRGSGRLI